MRRPTLSVVMPNYNHARFLPDSLGAILAESYQPDEVIILDDCSTDNSVEVIESYARKNPIVRLVRNERNMGVEWNVNQLLELATGDYVYSPSADDKILQGFFAKSMSLLAQYPQAGFGSTVGRLMGEHGEDRGIRALAVISKVARYFSPQEVREMLIKYGRWIDAPTVIYRRDVFRREGGYTVELGPFADQFANMVLALRYGACFVPEPLHCWRQMKSGHAASFAADFDRMLDNTNRAIGLMRSVHGGLFPVEYVKGFERHRKYMLSRLAGRCACANWEQTLSEAYHALLPEKSFGSRSVWFALRLLMRVQRLAGSVYSVVTLAPWRWWIRGRLSILLHLKTIVLREKLF